MPAGRRGGEPVEPRGACLLVGRWQSRREAACSPPSPNFFIGDQTISGSRSAHLPRFRHQSVGGPAEALVAGTAGRLPRKKPTSPAANPSIVILSAEGRIRLWRKRALFHNSESKPACR